MSASGIAAELGLSNLHSRLADKRDPPERVIPDSDGQLRAAIVRADHGNVWYVERVNVRADHAYRVLLLKPNFVRKPSMNPQDHIRGEYMTEEMQTCQAFIFDVPTAAVEAITSVGRLARRLSEQYRYGLQQTLVEKRRVHSDRDVLRVYQEYFVHG